MHDVLYKQVLGADLLAGVYGWLGLKMAIISFCVEFLPGMCYRYNHTTFYILSLLVETLSRGSTLTADRSLSKSYLSLIQDTIPKF